MNRTELFGLKEINLKNKIIIGLFVSLLAATSSLYAEDYSRSYSVGLDEIVEEAKTNSRLLESLRKKHKAAEILLDSEKAYFYPKVSLASNIKQHYGDSTANVDLNREGDLSVKVESKIYGDATNEKIEGARNVERAAFYDVKSKENEIYYIVLNALSKIERSRHYIHNANTLRQEMMEYLNSLGNAIKEGVSPASEFKKAELAIAKFDDAMFSEKSNIERYFYELKVATEINFHDSELVGIPFTMLESLSDEASHEFIQQDAIGNNFKVIAKEFNVKVLKYSALSQNEDIKLTAVNESFVDTIADKSSGAPTWKIQGESYIGLRLDMTLFDYQKNRNDEASILQYLAGSDGLEDEKQKIRSQVELLDTNYDATVLKQDNMKEQIELSRNLVESQKNDLWIDRVTHQDLIETLVSHNQSAISLLALDIQADTSIYTYWELKSESIF